MKICKKLPIQLFLMCFVFCLCLSGYMIRHGRATEQDLWQELKKENHFALIRHALAPGTGDPPNFNIRDCTTQRNLSERGRNQARNIGRLLRAKGIHRAQVYASQWCRCLETAHLLDLGPVQELEILNSFFRHFEKKKEQTAALKSWINDKEIRDLLILVTHQVNITAFTDIFPGSGEMVIVRKDGQDKFAVLGTIVFEY
ncbi:MAG: histidine phosphatase family protein [Desulfotignum sp.]|nr:histidine phosphatase family protein [Desulfotignum sp.]